MRLETGHTQQHDNDTSGIVEARDEQRRNAAASALREGIRAAQAGDRANARTHLLRASELDPTSESAWLWLASLSEYPEELIVFLNNVLDINPRNARANEWMRATKALLSKTFVQRGIDAASDGRNENAIQFFNQALENDQSNVTAWLWLARLADSDEWRVTYIEKVLELDPENEEARKESASIRQKLNEALLAEARAAAVAGHKSRAIELLDAFIAEFPSSEDGWILRAHLADSFDQKIAAFERVLEINPDNLAARVGLDSLRAILQTVSSPVAEASEHPNATAAKPDSEMPDDPVDEMENIAFAIDHERELEELTIHDKSPTQELVFPEAALCMANDSVETEQNNAERVFPDEPVYLDDLDIGFVENNENRESTFSVAIEESVDDTEQEIRSENFAWTMDTVAFSFSFPGGESAADEKPESFPAVPDLVNSNLVEVAANEESLADLDFDSSAVRSSVDPAVMPPTEMLDSAVSFENAQADTESGQTDFVQPAISTNGIDSVTYDQNASPFDSKVDNDVFENPPAEHRTEFEYSVIADEELEFVAKNLSETEAKIFIADSQYGPTADSQEQPAIENAIQIPVELGLPTGFPLVAENQTQSESLADTALTLQAVCPFCEAENPSPVFTCNSCLAILTLADLEILLSNTHADRQIIRGAIDNLESLRNERELTESELTTLGIGYLNLREFEQGFLYLQEASRKNPDNEFLARQVDSLFVRLEEISQQENVRVASAKPKSVLVVDDSATVRKLIAGKLEKSGYIVLTAADGIEALEMLKTNTPDLILLDISMPRMDGYQVCKAIRGMDSTKNTPVIMISGKDSFFDKVRGKMAGTTGYITKPFGPETLMKVIESYLNGQNGQNV